MINWIWAEEIFDLRSLGEYVSFAVFDVLFWRGTALFYTSTAIFYFISRKSVSVNCRKVLQQISRFFGRVAVEWRPTNYFRFKNKTPCTGVLFFAFLNI